MLRLTLAQMRRSLGRLVAAGIAVGIGTAFVAATLLASAALERTTYDTVAQRYGDADLVVADGEVSDATLAAVSDVPGVAAVHGYREVGIDVVGPDGRTTVVATGDPVEPRLRATELAAGTMPSRPDEIALPTVVAELVGVTTGDTVEVTVTAWRFTETADGLASSAEEERVEELRVVGLVEQTSSAYLGTTGTAVVTDELVASWTRFQDGEATPGWYRYATVLVDDGADVEAVRADAREATRDLALVGVRTLDEQAAHETAEATGSPQVFAAIVLGFAAVAMFVAALVMSNTFAVVVAQRTRTLALLRCVGADRRQLRRSVVLEALLVGVAASTVGVLVGVAAVQVTLLVLTGAGTDVPLPTTLTVTPLAVLAPLAVGTVVTVLAALGPARAATRVAPLAALRQDAAPTADAPAGRGRLVLAGLLMAGGAVGLAGGVVVAGQVALLPGLALGVLGGAVSFVGVVLGAIAWVPATLALVGRLLGHRAGTSVRLAAANSVRNPRRTAATSAALFIGVTLVAMMATGAASTREALADTLEQQFPVDLMVAGDWTGAGTATLSADLIAEIEEVDGVAAVAPLAGTVAEVEVDASETAVVDVFGVDPALARATLLVPEDVEGLVPGVALVPADFEEWYGIGDGETLELRPQDGGTPITLVTRTTAVAGQVLVTPEDLADLAPDATTSRVWVRLADLDDAERVVGAVTAAASTSGESVETIGPAAERAYLQRVVNTLLAVVVGLLGVAVVIALVGVTNTLSLSVLERRRESGTLRALGLTRRQLRGTLAVEGALIAGVGAVVGSVLGVVYGWAGARTLLAEVSPVALVVPWRDLGFVLLVALAAGLLASVLPGRAAARTSPVEALATD